MGAVRPPFANPKVVGLANCEAALDDSAAPAVAVRERHANEVAPPSVGEDERVAQALPLDERRAADRELLSGVGRLRVLDAEMHAGLPVVPVQAGRPTRRPKPEERLA